MSSSNGARAEMFRLLHSMSATESVDEFCPKVCPLLHNCGCTVHNIPIYQVHKFLQATFNSFFSNCEGLGEINENEKYVIWFDYHFSSRIYSLQTLHKSMGKIVRVILTTEGELWDAYKVNFNANDIRWKNHIFHRETYIMYSTDRCSLELCTFESNFCHSCLNSIIPDSR